MPTVYQGHYNAFMRTIEPELIPCLRQYNIRFYAYSPLSGGIVNPKNRENANSSGGCFDPKGPYSQHYRSLYWKQGYFDALDLLNKVSQGNGLDSTDVVLRWLVHHSQVSREKGDGRSHLHCFWLITNISSIGIILGGSSYEHIKNNFDATEQGPLPDDVLKAIEEAWEIAKPHCRKHFV